MGVIYTQNGDPLEVRGNKIYRKDGRQVATLKGNKAFGSDGKYMGTIVGDRLIFRSSDKSYRGSRFKPAIGSRFSRRKSTRSRLR